ncbi:MAG: hypothetical protein K8S27_11850 [Candidatus Omnitrophica bacterium]|nr:hypothetical protein [Candidatus Omnitrophota bacterium]
MKNTKFEAVLGCLFIFLFILSVMVIGLDVLSRPYISSRSSFERQALSSDVRHSYPYVMFSGNPSAASLNASGYKGPVPAMPKSQAEYRVIFLGGSTLINGDPTIPQLIDHLFEQDGLGHVRVYNFGVVSSVTSMELVKIFMEAVDYAPDLIVMYGGGNDIIQSFFSDPRPGYPFNFFVYENNPLLESDIRRYPAGFMLLFGSNLLRSYYPDMFREKFFPMDAVRREIGYGTPEWHEEIANTYIKNIFKADKISEAFGAEFISFFQPLVFYKEQLTQKEEVDTVFQFKEGAMYIGRGIHHKINHLRENDRRKFVDLRYLFAGETGPVFSDFIHIRQEAKPVVAREIYKSLRPLIKEGPDEKIWF